MPSWFRTTWVLLCSLLVFLVNAAIVQMVVVYVLRSWLQLHYPIARLYYGGEHDEQQELFNTPSENAPGNAFSLLLTVEYIVATLFLQPLLVFTSWLPAVRVWEHRMDRKMSDGVPFDLYQVLSQFVLRYNVWFLAGWFPVLVLEDLQNCELRCRELMNRFQRLVFQCKMQRQMRSGARLTGSSVMGLMEEAARYCPRPTFSPKVILFLLSPHIFLISPQHYL